MKTMTRFAVMSALALGLGLAQPVFAMGGGGAPATAEPAKADPNLDAAKKAIDAKNWAGAIPLLESVVAKDAKNADAFNWLGFAQRNNGNLPAAFDAYGKALAIDPKHRGAHEYLGEAYLKANDLPKAEEQLKKLDSLCSFGCAEYTELKTKIAAYKAAKPS